MVLLRCIDGLLLWYAICRLLLLQLLNLLNLLLLRHGI